MADKPHGHGVMTFADGSTYDGQFNHGLKQGQGTYVHCTGIPMSNPSRSSSSMFEIFSFI